MNLMVGMRVKMSEAGKKRWRDSLNNPHDNVGVVFEVLSERSSMSVRVIWPKTTWPNCYYKEDLLPILMDKPLEDYL